MWANDQELRKIMEGNKLTILRQHTKEYPKWEYNFPTKCTRKAIKLISCLEWYWNMWINEINGCSKRNGFSKDGSETGYQIQATFVNKYAIWCL